MSMHKVIVRRRNGEVLYEETCINALAPPVHTHDWNHLGLPKHWKRPKNQPGGAYSCSQGPDDTEITVPDDYVP